MFYDKFCENEPHFMSLKFETYSTVFDENECIKNISFVKS